MKKLTLLLVLVALLSPLLRAQVTSNFTASPTSGCANLTVFFTNQSTGNVTGWNWQITNATTGATVFTSNLPNPAFLFQAGIYNVCLTVTGPGGLTNTFCRTNYITSNAPPVAAFSLNAPTGCSPHDVTFTDNSVQGTCPITQWSWNFGNATSGNTQNPTVTYTTTQGTQTFQPSLQVTDACGCTSFVSGSAGNNTLVNLTGPPTANFNITSPTTACVPPLTVSFADASTTPSGGSFTYDWDFDGDGLTDATTANPSFTYTALGTYTTHLTVTDNITNCTDDFTSSTNIVIGSGNVNFTVSDTTICAGQSIQFTDLTTGTASGWSWNFGDGGAGSNLQSPSRVFNTPGTYLVTLTANSDGCNGTFTFPQQITVSAIPTVAPAASVTNACSVPLSVNFTANSTNATTWLWAFGDAASGANNVSTLQDPSHTFNSFGNYTVTLNASNVGGCSASGTVSINIQPVTAAFNVAPRDGCAPVTAILSDASTSTFPINSWNWQITDQTGAVVGTSVLQNPAALVLVDTGCVDVRLIVSNTAGCIDTLLATDTICAGTQINVDFTAVNTNTCARDQVVFTSNITGGHIDRVFWDFGDGSNSVALNPSHEYGDLDSFTVCLTVWNYGCDTTFCRENYVNILGPIADFDPRHLCVPLDSIYSWSFYNTSQRANRYHWDFGTGNPADTSNLANPRFDYTTAGSGTYTVTLIAYNDTTNCDFTITKTVLVANPQSQFTVNQTVGCIPFSLPITNTSVDAVQYAWSAPGGTIGAAGAASPGIVYNTAGFYTPVSLTVTDGNGCADTSVFVPQITASGVTTSFTVSNNLGCAPLDPVFTSTSTSFPPSSTVNNWSWTFASGLPSTAVGSPNATTRYYTAGTFPVTLTATNDLGCVAASTNSTAVLVTKPSTGFTVAPIACIGQNILLVNTTTGNAPIATWAWDFGNGDVSNVQSPNYTYPADGTYTICLTATDQNGCDSTFCSNITIGTPIAAFTGNPVFAQCPPLNSSFIDQSANAVSWAWSFGDGIGFSNLQNPSYTYSQPGLFDVRLIVTSASGCRDTLLQNDYVTVQGPSGTFTFTPNQGCVPLTVTATINYVGANSLIFLSGDGGFVNQATPSINGQTTVTYDYLYGGTWTPAVQFIDQGSGCVTTSISPMPVNADSLVLDFSASDTTLCANDCISFSPSIASGSTVSGIQWSFPGGTPSSSTSAIPNVCYTTPGIYPVTLTATNTFCNKSITKTTYIRVEAPPTAAFSFVPDNVCAPATIQFTDLSTSAALPLTYAWDFDNNGTTDATAINPSFTFATGGVYNVKLTVTTPNGCSTSATHPVTILALPTPNAGLDRAICLNNSTTLGATGGASYAWSPASTLSDPTIANPVATPLTTTTYTVTVTGANGCTASDEVVVTVNTLPIANADVDRSVCTNVSTVLAGSATVGTPNYTFAWSSGANTANATVTAAFPSQTYTLTVTDANGCTDTDDVTVTVFALPVVSITASQDTVCSGVSVTLTANGASTYNWTPAFVGATQSVVAPNVGNNTYTVTGTDTNGCTASATQIINILALPPIVAGADRSICLNTSTTLSASGAVSYLWSPAGTLSDPTLSNPVASPLTTTTYIVTGTGANGCTATADIVVTVNALPIANASNDRSVCDGVSTVLAGSATSGTPNYTFAWSSGANTANATVTAALPSQTYILTVTDANGCTDTDDVTVNVFALPVVTLVASQDTICAGTPIVLTAGGAVSYAWTPVFSGAVQNVTPPNVGNNVYSVTGTDINGCTASATQTIRVNALPNTSATTTDYYICINDQTQLNVTPTGAGFTYNWAPSSTLDNANIPNPTATPLVTTLYNVTVTDNNGCAQADTVLITVSTFALPVITISPDTTICYGSFVQLFVSGGYNTTTAYNWDTAQSGLTCYTHCSNPVASPLATTTYQVTVEGDGGCVDEAFVTVSVRDERVPFLPADPTICEGDSVTATITLGTNPIWSGDTHRSCTVCSSADLYPNEDATFYAEVTRNGCRIQDTINVNVLSPTDISAGTDLVLCLGDSVQLQGSAFGTFAWTPNIAISDTTILDPYVNPDTTRLYFLTATQGLCTLIDTVQVSVFEGANISVNDVVVCANEPIDLLATGTATAFSWSPAIGLDSTDVASPTATLTATQTYFVTGLLGNCPSDTDTMTVTVNTPISLLPEYNQSFLAGQSVTLHVYGIDNPADYSYLWSPAAGLSCPTCPTPLVQPTANTTYTVVVTDQNGCTATMPVNLRLVETCDESLVIVPNAFSPNGDGLNDMFYARSNAISKYERFAVFNRWGENLFMTTNPAEGWDGKQKGEPAQSGVYVWFVEYICPLNGEKVVRSGNVTLVR